MRFVWFKERQEHAEWSDQASPDNTENLNNEENEKALDIDHKI
jgi:hypothetical protein